MRTLLLSLLLAGPASAAELAGVTLPDTTTAADGTSLVLNGLGLREFMWIDIYVGALYLPEKMADGTKATTANVPKRIEMRFIFRKVGREKFLDVFRDGLAEQPDLGDMTSEIAQLEAMVTGDVHAGDVILLDYLPEKGVTVSFNGKALGTIEGERFMKGLFGMFVGDAPVNDKLKKALLGG